MWSSVKSWWGGENLQTTSGGANEEKAANTNTAERQGLWQQLSSFIGKDITSMISLPVWIFEPLSFLQIMCEPMQYETLLQKASEATDSCFRLAYLSTFIVAGYSLAVRSKKPFNPLLGETFEFVPKDKKFKFFAEQVSHHPPIGVSRCESENYTLQLEMELKTKFRGNSTDVIVLGKNHFDIPKYKDHFTWGHLETCAYNVILGGMWVDHFGEIEIKNETTGDVCALKLTKAGWLGSGRWEVYGEVKNAAGKNRVILSGKWNDKIMGTKLDDNGAEVGNTVIWQKESPSTDKWGWNKFAYEMNELSPEYEKTLPKNDSRLRGDRRALEQDNLDLAGKEKHRLEEEQRKIRKDREAKGEHYTPKYFQKIEENGVHKEWKYVGKYWEDREVSNATSKLEELKTT